MAGSAKIKAGEAFLALTVDDSKFAAGLDRAQRKLQKIGSAFKQVGLAASAFGGAVTAALGVAVKSFADFGSALDDAAKRTGVSVESLSALKFAAEQSGATFANVELAIRTMQKQLFNASQGAEVATTALDALGLSIDDLQGQSPGKQFEIIAAKLRGIEDPTTKAAVAMKLFGRSGTALLPAINDLEALKQQAEATGNIMSAESAAAAEKFGDALDLLGKIAQGIKNAIGAALVGPLSEVVAALNNNVGAAIKFIAQHKGLVQAIGAIGVAMTAAGAAAYAFGTALTLLSAHPVIAGLTLVAGAIAGIATALRDVDAQGRAANDRLRELAKTPAVLFFPQQQKAAGGFSNAPETFEQRGDRLLREKRERTARLHSGPQVSTGVGQLIAGELRTLFKASGLIVAAQRLRAGFNAEQAADVQGQIEALEQSAKKVGLSSSSRSTFGGKFAQQALGITGGGNAELNEAKKQTALLKEVKELLKQGKFKEANAALAVGDD